VATIEAVAAALDELPQGTPVVLDPVMVAESGAQLLEPTARTVLIELLLPRATVVTPNVPEATALAGAAPSGSQAVQRNGGGAPCDLEIVARAVHALGPATVVVTGGHREHAVDVFYDGTAMIEIPGERHPDGAAHGSGCTHSAALAARLAWGDQPLQAARVAKQLAARAVRDGLSVIGAGAGPVNVLGIGRRRGRDPCPDQVERAQDAGGRRPDPGV
jgi:hydroxymethylpyrimidine/phosphomethylpyrimidine kinase